MHTQRSPFLPLALIVLAVAIVTAAFVIASAISAASTQQALATQLAAEHQAAAVQQAAGTNFLASETARDAANQASLAAQHQTNLDMARSIGR